VPPPSPGVPAQLFYSYSHKDEKLRDQLQIHLSSLIRDWQISGWHDRKIDAGADWEGVIDDHLKAAGIILLLVSADFIASKYCYDIEVRCAMERHRKGQARVIPVILRPCDWKTAIFAHLQALPTDGKPVTRWTNRDEAFLNIAQGIRRALQEISFSEAPATATKQSTALPVPALNTLHQLPAPPADFTGRTSELAELHQAVKTGGVTVCGMQGLGGVGKTALALKLAEQLKPDYPDAHFYLDLKGGSPRPLTPRNAMAHIVCAWHPMAQLPEHEAEMAPLYRSILDGKRALLLMDNASDAEQVEPLIPPAGCLLLVTSRKHFTLPALVGKNLDKLSAAEARALLLRIAPSLKKENPDQIDELASLCGYLPLALRAVASALEEKKTIRPTDYANRLKTIGKHLLLKVDPSIEKNVGAALQSIYEQLSDELRQKLRLLSVFPDSFDLLASGAVCETLPAVAEDMLRELLSYSFIEFEETAQRYSLHDLIRLFAAQLLSAEERHAAQRRHAEHYLRVLGAADELYLRGGESMTRGLALFDAEWANIQAGHGWVVANQDDHAIAEWCWKYPDAGVHCLSLRQPPHERIRWLESALAAAQRLKQPAWEANSLSNLGIAYHDLGEYRHAIEYHEKRLQIARLIGDHRGEGYALGNLGRAYRNLGDYRRAIEFLEHDLRIAREIGDRRGEGTTLGNLGLAYDNLGDHRRAIEYHEQHLKITREFGNRLEEGRALGNLGLGFYSLGEYRRAIGYYQQDIQIAREIGDRRGESDVLGNLGSAYNRLGEYHRAIECYEQQLKIAREIRNRVAENRALGGLGTAHYRMGEHYLATVYQEQSLQIAREIGDRLGEGHAHWNCALALHELGDRAATMVRATSALKIYETLKSPHASTVRAQLAEWHEEDKASGKIE
jgi:tetratricopeptide (TPR) repeat protein